MVKSAPVSRRIFLSLAALLPLGLWSRPAAARRTPSATEGPYYPTESMRFTDADNDLVSIKGGTALAKGEVIVLKGRVFDRDGKPAAGARVEIWQCDANGRYLHSADPRRGGYDTTFQGFGHVVTGDDGAYAFRTIKPVAYPGRTPHIHVKVIDGSRELTTQFYIKGHPLNRGDWLFRRMPRAEREAVSMTFTAGTDGPEARVDVHL